MQLGLTDADGFAISMIAILGLSFSFVFVILIGIIRHARKHRSESEELIEAVCREEQAQAVADSSTKAKPEPWEKQADWWKGDS